METIKLSVVARDWGGGGRTHTFVKTHRMYNTQSEL